MTTTPTYAENSPKAERPTFSLARAVSIAVGAGLMLYGMRRRSWFGRLITSAGTGLIARSIGTEGALASIFQSFKDRLAQSNSKRLPSSL